MNKVLLIMDMEGCIGVYDMEDRINSRKLMIDETDILLNHLVHICGFSVTVVDSHDSGHNVDELVEKYPNVSFAAHIWNVKNIETFDFALLSGFHSRSGVSGWFAHTLRPEIDSVLLAGKIVGEIELMTNFLAFYGVKVCFVAGDESAKEEVKRSKALFFPTKHAGIVSPPKSEIYKSLISKMEQSLTSRENDPYFYNDGIIEVQFQNNDYLRFFPSYFFLIEDNRIVFQNVIDFYNNAFSFCRYLNAAMAHRIEAIRRIKNVIRNEFSDSAKFSLIHDDVENILEKNVFELTSEDICMVKKILTRYSTSLNCHMLIKK